MVPLLLDRDLPAEQVADAVRRFQISAIWDGPSADLGKSAGEGTRTSDVVWQLTGHDSPPLNPNLALLLLTSGSTGRPRCVRLSYTNLAANARSIAAFQELSPSDRPLLTLPWSSAFGLSVVNSHWGVGGTLLLSEATMIQREFWDQFRGQAATSLAGVPFTFAQLKRLQLERLGLPTLRMLLQAGGRLSPELVQFFADLGQQLGYRLFVMYGQTEATARMAYLDPALATVKPTSIGRPIPGGELLVRDHHGKILTESGQVGELFYRGPNVMLGYADSADDLTLDCVNGGEIGTGDLGYRDEQGDYFVAGRLSRFVKLEGKRVHLDAIEQALRDWGFEALAVGDDTQVIAAVRSTATSNYSLDEIKRRLAAHFRVSYLWFSVQRLVEIPYLPNGKVDYWRFAALHSRSDHVE
jgi:acyl-CoA synthetase (AMP-forming)/AMP-acid ligase II